MNPTHRDAFLTSAWNDLSIMGILNITPDSFSDGGHYLKAESALHHAKLMVEEGAGIIDIGAESTRPNATEISSEEEQSRLLTALKLISDNLDIPLSVDTYKAETAKAALAAGASVINDVWGLQRDAGMADVVADAKAAVIIMHNRKEEDTHKDVMDEIEVFFERSLTIAQKASIPERHIILDPGIGFLKNRDQNLEIMSKLEQLQRFGFPILMGVSRKRFIGDILNVPPMERMVGTVASNLYCFMKGARIFRVHDVKPHVEAFKMIQALGK